VVLNEVESTYAIRLAYLGNDIWVCQQRSEKRQNVDIPECAIWILEFIDSESCRARIETRKSEILDMLIEQYSSSSSPTSTSQAYETLTAFSGPGELLADPTTGHDRAYG